MLPSDFPELCSFAALSDQWTREGWAVRDGLLGEGLLPWSSGGLPLVQLQLAQAAETGSGFQQVPLFYSLKACSTNGWGDCHRTLLPTPELKIHTQLFSEPAQKKTFHRSYLLGFCQNSVSSPCQGRGIFIVGTWLSSNSNCFVLFCF